MKKVLGVYRTFLQTLNPDSYEGFAESTTKNTLKYYGSLIFVAFIVMIIVLIPALVQLPKNIESTFDKIDTLTFNTTIKTIEPIAIPEKNPILLINYQNKTPTETANVILNNDVLYVGVLMQKYVKDLHVYKDVKQNKETISKIIATILLLMAPTVALIFFIYILIKFFVIAVIASLLGMVIAKIMSHKIKYKQMFNTAIYGISLTVLLDLIFFALGFSFYCIQYLPLLVYLISGVTHAGEKIDKKMKGKYLEVKG